VFDTTPLYRSPFEGHTPGTQAAADGSVGVHVHAGMLSQVTQVSTWGSGIDALSQQLQSALGQAVPAHTGQTQATALGLCLRTGPQEFLVVNQSSSPSASNTTALLRQHISADMGTVTDLSHARCQISIEGPQCVATLAKLFALDFRAAAFPINEVKLSGTHHMPCTLLRTGPHSFVLYAFSSYAFDTLATLMDAAREYGVQLSR
jgi:heterotetrameric sarcosine oxidase gamma subunit